MKFISTAVALSGFVYSVAGFNMTERQTNVANIKIEGFEITRFIQEKYNPKDIASLLCAKPKPKHHKKRHHKRHHKESDSCSSTSSSDSHSRSSYSNSYSTSRSSDSCSKSVSEFSDEFCEAKTYKLFGKFEVENVELKVSDLRHGRKHQNCITCKSCINKIFSELTPCETSYGLMYLILALKNAERNTYDPLVWEYIIKLFHQWECEKKKECCNNKDKFPPREPRADLRAETKLILEDHLYLTFNRTGCNKKSKECFEQSDSSNESDCKNGSTCVKKCSLRNKYFECVLKYDATTVIEYLINKESLRIIFKSFLEEYKETCLKKKESHKHCKTIKTVELFRIVMEKYVDELLDVISKINACHPSKNVGCEYFCFVPYETYQAGTYHAQAAVLNVTKQLKL